MHRVSLSVPRSTALVVMAAVSLPPIASAQAPQSWRDQRRT